MENMTALICCFSKAYHYENYKCRIFNDNVSKKILSIEEYANISTNMSNGIDYFNKNFKGTPEDALKWIINNQISPSILGRSVFCEKLLKNAIKLGCKQYLIYASGYDTFAYRNKSDISIFEIDREEIIKDKINRLDRANIDHSKINYVKCDLTSKDFIDKINYRKNELSFNSLLGITYYLTKEEFKNIINIIANNVSENSSIVFDYQTYEDSKQTKINSELANGANEEMKSKYTYNEIEKLLSENNFLIYEHLNHQEMTKNNFEIFNMFNKDKIVAPLGVNYCLAVKK